MTRTIIAIAQEPVNTITSYTLTSPLGDSTVLLGHKNCDAALVGGRIQSLFGVGEQNINNIIISALFTTIGDQIHLNLADGWLIEIHHSYSTLSQMLNIYHPRMLAQAPSASLAVLSWCNSTANSEGLVLPSASCLGRNSTTNKKHQTLIEFGSTAPKRRRNNKNSIDDLAQNLGNNIFNNVDPKYDKIKEDDVVVMPPPLAPTFLTNTKQDQAQVVLTSNVLETFPAWSKITSIDLCCPVHKSLWNPSTSLPQSLTRIWHRTMSSPQILICNNVTTPLPAGIEMLNPRLTA